MDLRVPQTVANPPTCQRTLVGRRCPVMSANGWNIEQETVCCWNIWIQRNSTLLLVRPWVDWLQPCQPIATRDGIWIVTHRTGIRS